MFKLINSFEPKIIRNCNKNVTDNMKTFFICTIRSKPGTSQSKLGFFLVFGILYINVHFHFVRTNDDETDKRLIDNPNNPSKDDKDGDENLESNKRKRPELSSLELFQKVH